MFSVYVDILKQERRTPPHAGGLHPALRERGRAIPSSHIVPKIQGRPDHVASPIKMRPSMGGAGHVVPAPKGNSTMGIIMPLYTLGIVLFFLYTISKVCCLYFTFSLFLNTIKEHFLKDKEMLLFKSYFLR